MSGAPDNFAFLDNYDRRLARIARQAEGYVHTDPESCLFKLRLLVETMAQMMVRTSIPQLNSNDLGAMLSALERAQLLDRRQADSMHAIRRDGNAAVHGIAAPSTTAMRRLRDAHGLSQWFAAIVRRGAKVARSPFVMPDAPTAAEAVRQLEADALEDTIELQRHRTRDALLLFRDQAEIDLWAPRLRAELEALEEVAAFAGETVIDSETVEIMMMLELEQLLEHPVMGMTARGHQREGTAALSEVRKSLDAREADYAQQRERIARSLHDGGTGQAS
ncbi:MAG: DUF4145 domain-containing protein [Planctomycetota bacterium]|nr:DUF4145 domain-containing protein [Planctomycetota bacterium]MDA1106445.1 DUF4145 domain-containing protein [Planctomycetota bacterium]